MIFRHDEMIDCTIIPFQNYQGKQHVTISLVSSKTGEVESKNKVIGNDDEEFAVLQIDTHPKTALYHH